MQQGIYRATRERALDEPFGGVTGIHSSQNALDMKHFAPREKQLPQPGGLCEDDVFRQS